MKAVLAGASFIALAAGDVPNGVFCPAIPEGLDAVYADMHDGDKKHITVKGGAMTIKPSGNNQTWVVHTQLDPATCSANVDFNVPGKPGVPPVNLTATLWKSVTLTGDSKTEFEFTDPSGTLPAGPLNRWVEIGSDRKSGAPSCPDAWKAVYADMHDGDKKEITISGSKLSITPSGNNQSWEVRSVVDAKTCSAIIDFNVPGKPGPPPVKLQATFWNTATSFRAKSEFEFTDPSGTLAAKDFPLNHWVEIGKSSVEMDKPEGSCGGDKPSKVADCHNVDIGSCGNACCKLLINVKEDPMTAAKLLNTSLANGGPDGYYTRQLLDEGVTGFFDLSAFKPELPIIGQVHHMTSGPKHYNDTIDFTITKTSTGSVIKAFSLSLVGGALGDNGQNYKNIVMALKSVQWEEGGALQITNADDSCQQQSIIV